MKGFIEIESVSGQPHTIRAKNVQMVKRTMPDDEGRERTLIRFGDHEMDRVFTWESYGDVMDKLEEANG